MIGLILCGGESSRMGFDKGLLKVENTSWANKAFEKCTALHLKTFIAIRGEQLSSYAPLFDQVVFIQDNENLDYRGPLKGIMSAHLSFPTEDILVLACDMLNMEETTLMALVKMQESNPQYQAYCFLNQGNMEPLATLYMASGLAIIQQLYQKKALQKHSMKYVLSTLNTYCNPLDATTQISFQNFNTPSDLFNL